MDSDDLSLFPLASRKLTIKFNIYLVASAKNVLACICTVFPT